LVIVLFRNNVRADIDQAKYERTFERMLELAQQMPGFISIEGFSAPDGGELAVVRFESEETLKAWKQHPEHMEVQDKARAEFYDSYHITVATHVREYGFQREPDADVAAPAR
jgi:heme-degrading monooxygenase HmoA